MKKNHQDPIVVEQDADAADVVSFPSSVQERLDEAKALLSQDRTSEAAAALQRAGAELAQTNPEMLALLVAAQLGRSRIVEESDETDTVTVTTGRYAMGIRYGKDQTVTENRKAGKRTIRLE